MGGTVSNCHVAHNVAIRTAKKAACDVGGIVGYNDRNGIVTGCTSAAVITCAVTTDCVAFGGIVGNNSWGTVTGCTATGVIVPNVSKAGAVAGPNSSTISGNEYHSSLVGSYAFNIGAGTGDVTDGATLNNSSLVLYTDRDNSALIAAYAATYNSNSSTAHNASHPTVSSLKVTLKVTPCTRTARGTRCVCRSTWSSAARCSTVPW